MYPFQYNTYIIHIHNHLIHGIWCILQDEMGMRSVFFLFEMLDCSKTWHSSCNKGGLSFNCALRWRQVVPFATCNRFSKLKPSSIYLQHVPANTTTGALVGTKEEIYLYTKRYMPRCSSYPESDTLDKYVDLRSIENSYRWEKRGKTTKKRWFLSKTTRFRDAHLNTLFAFSRQQLPDSAPDDGLIRQRHGTGLVQAAVDF